MTAFPPPRLNGWESLSGPVHRAAHDQISLAYRQCMAATDAAGRGRRPLSQEQLAFLDERCRASENRQLLDLAAQVFGRRGHFDKSIALFKAALDQDPNTLNTRLSLVVTLHLARRYADEIPHLGSHQYASCRCSGSRFAIQAGTWGGAPDLADRGIALLKQHHPKLVPLAERFRNTPPPPPREGSRPSDRVSIRTPKAKSIGAVRAARERIACLSFLAVQAGFAANHRAASAAMRGTAKLDPEAWMSTPR